MQNMSFDEWQNWSVYIDMMTRKKWSVCPGDTAEHRSLAFAADLSELIVTTSHSI